MPKQFLSIQEAAARLGVSTKTLRRWEEKGIVTPKRTVGNQRRYSIADIEKADKQSLTINEAAQRLGLSSKTLRRWEEKGIITPQRTSGNQRRYAVSEIEVLKDKNPREIVTTKLKKQAAKDLLQLEKERFFDLSSVKAPETPKNPIIRPVVADFDPVVYFSSETSINRHPELVSGSPIKADEMPKQVRHDSFLNNSSNPSFSRYFTPKSAAWGGAFLSIAAVLLFITSLSQVSVPVKLLSLLPYLNNSNTIKDNKAVSGNEVLATETQKHDYRFKISVPVEMLSTASVSGNLTAPNILYNVVAGDNITISGDRQNPTISANLSLDAGTGITIADGTITNADPGSAQNIFAKIKVGSETISAGNNTDTFELAAGSNVTLSTDTSNKKITISANSASANGLTVEEGDTTIGSSINTIDFLGGDFDVGESPTGEANIQLAATLTSVTGVAGNFGIGGSLTVGGDTISDFTGVNSGLEVTGGTLSLITTCADNEILKYTALGGWECSSDAGAGGAVGGIGAQNQIAFWTNATTLSGNNNFYWDNGTEKFGIGTGGAPTGKFTVNGAVPGKALAILNETGDQNILTASASGITQLNLDRSGNLAIEGELSDLSGTILTINDDLKVTGNDIIDSADNTRISLGATTTVTASNLTLSGTSTLDATSLTAFNGGATAINFSEFDVDATTGSITIDDDGNAGNITIDGTRLDIDSLDFAAAGTLTTGGVSDLTITAGGGNVLFTSGTTLNVGGGAASSFNFFADSVAGADGTIMGTDSDLYVQGDLEVDGSIRLNNQTYTFPATAGSNGYVLSTNGSGTLSWTDTAGFGTNYWDLANGTLNPKNSTVDLLIGGTATNGAKFAFSNVAGGTPTASISATAGNALSLSASGSIFTTNKQTLTLGSTSTGNIVIGNTGFTTCTALETVNGVLTCGTDDLGSAGTNYWQLISGAISPFSETLDVLIGSTSTNSAEFAITGIVAGTPTATLSATTNGYGLSLTASNGTIQSLNKGNLTLGGATTGTIILANPTTFSSTLTLGGDTISDFTGTTLQVSSGILETVLGNTVDLTSEVTGILPIASGGSPFEQGQGAIFERITTQDLLLGSVSTNSAKFAFTNVAGGTPTASIAGTGNNSLSLTGNGTIATTNEQSLTLGSASTGDLSFIVGTSNNLTINGIAGATVGAATCVTTTNGIVTGTGSCSSPQSLFIWNTISGAIVQGNTTNDLLLGSVSTDSARFAVTNIAGGTPTASLSAGLAGGAFLTAAGQLQTTNNQSLTLGGGNTGSIVIGNSGFTSCTSLETVNGVLTCGNDDVGSAGTNYLQLVNGSISPFSETLDLLVGSTATGSAEFAITGIAAGTPTASLSATTNGNGLSLNASDSRIQSLNLSTLTLGGDTTGNIVLSGRNGSSNSIYFQGYNCSAFSNGGTLTVDANGLVQCAADDSSTGAGTLDIQEGGVGIVSGATVMNFAASDFNVSLVPTTQGDVSIDYANSGITRRNNAEVIGGQWSFLSDILAGGTSTSSARFAVLNMMGAGTPTASISATSGGGALSLTPNALTTQNAQTLTLGGANTGNIIISPRNGSGDVQINGTTTLNGLTYTWPGTQNTGYVLQTNGSGVLSWVDPGTLPTVNYWDRANGAVYPKNAESNDLLIGSTATASAEFAITGISAGTPTATLSATTNGYGLSLTASNGTIQSLNKGTLTLGGATTGTIILANPTTLSSTLTLGGDTISDFTGTTLQVSSGILETVLGNTVDLTSEVTGILPIASGGSPFEQGQGAIFERITTQDLLLGSTATNTAKFAFTNVAGGTPTASISGSSNRALSLDANGIISTTNKQTLTLGSASTGDLSFIVGTGNNLTINGIAGATVTASCVTTVNGIVTGGASCPAVSANDIWQTRNGAILQGNTTQDLLIGGTATESAKFAVLNINPGSGTPTASVSGTNGGAFLTADGILGTTAKQSLTLGNSSTGDILLGTDATARTITIGNATGVTALNIDTGTGGINLGDNANSKTIDIGGVTNSGTDIIRIATNGSAADIITVGNNNPATTLALTGGTAWSIDTAGIATFSQLNVDNLKLDGNTFSATGDITIDASGDDIVSTDRLTLGSLTPTTLATLEVRGLSGTLSVATVSGSTSFASLVIENSGAGDIFTASASGRQRMTLTNAGELRFYDADASNYTGFKTPSNITSNAVYELPAAFPSSNNYVLQSNTSGVLSWVDPGTLPTVNYWDRANGAVYPKNAESNDLLIGSTATASAEFAITGISAGTPTATLSATTNGYGLSLTASNGTIQSLNMGTLTLGGATTGNIVLDAGSGLITLSDPTSLSSTLSVAGNFNANADVVLGDATTDNITFTGRVAQDSDIIPITTTGTNDLGSALLPWDNLYVGSVIQNGTTLDATYAPINANFITVTANGTLTGETGIDALTTAISTTSTLNVDGASTLGAVTLDPNANLILSAGTGKIGLGTSSPLATLDVRGNLGTIPAASIAANSSFAALVVDNAGSGDIFTASSSGLSRFTVKQNGTIQLASVYNNCTALETVNGLLTCGVDDTGAANGSNWTLDAVNGVLRPNNNTLDILIGGTATNSARFAFVNIAGGTPTASIAGTGSNSLSLNGNGTIGTTNEQTLTLGNTSTGDINFFIGTGNNLSVNGIAGQTIGAATCVTTTNGIVTGTGSCTSPASLFIWNNNSGAIIEGNTTQDLLLGSVSTASARFAFTNVAGGTPTASLSAGLAGGSFLTASGILQTTNNQSLTLGGDQTGDITLSARSGAGRLALNAGSLTINGTPGITSVTPTCVSFTNGIVTGAGGCGVGSGGSVWTFNTTDGTLYPMNSTMDLLIGGVSTASAKFAIINVAGSNTPVASVSAGTTGAAFLSANGSLQTTNRQSITLGGGNSGNVVVSGLGTGVVHSTNGVLSSTTVNLASEVSGILPVANGGSPFEPTNNGALVERITTQDFLLGGVATTSSKFAFTGVAGPSTPVASISANPSSGTSTGLSLSGTGTIQSLNMNTLTIGGNTSGNITLSNATFANAGLTVASGQNLTLAGLTASNNQVLYANTSGVVSAASTATSNLCLVSGATPSWQSCALGAGTNFWQSTANGTISPYNNTVDILFGGAASTSATFHLYGSNAFAGTQTVASVGANTSFAGLVVDNKVGDLFAASSSGINRFVIKQNGNVGIGTTIPTAMLNIVQANNRTNGLRIDAIDDNFLSNAFAVYDYSGNIGLGYNGAGRSTTIRGGLTGLIPAAFIRADQDTISLRVGSDSNNTFFGTSSIASIAAKTSFSTLVVDNGVGDIFTASSSGLNRFVIKQNGNVGIGTTLPTAQLSVGGGTASSNNRAIFKGITDDDILALENFSSTKKWALTVAGNNFKIGEQGVQYRMTIQNGGFVGIGTESPLATLDVRAATVGNPFGSNHRPVASISGQTSAAALIVDNSSVGDIFTASSSGLSRFTITQNGNVGIGTTTPTALLDVAGTASISSALTFRAGASSIQTTNNNTLTIGGSTTGNISIEDRVVTSTGDLILDPFDEVYFGDTKNLVIGGHPGNVNYNVISDAGNTSHTLNSDNDLYVEGDFEVDGTFFADGNIDTGLTLGSVVFAGTNGILSENNNNFFWDNSNNRLGLGVNSNLAGTLDLRSTSGTLPGATISGRTSFAGLVVDNTGAGDLFTASSAGLPRFTIAQNGNVGIGTAVASTYALNVVSPDQSGNMLRLERTGSNNPNNWNFQITSNNAAGLAAGSLSLVNGTNAGFGIRTANSNVFTAIFDNSNRSLSLPNGIGTVPTASVAGATTFAGMLVDNSVGDLFTASSSGRSRFTITQNGAIQLTGNTNFITTLTSAATGAQNITLPDASGTLCISGSASCGFSIGTNYWQSTALGTFTPGNTTMDLLFGSTATNSATFHLYGTTALAGTAPVASIGANTIKAAFMVDNRVGDLFTASSSGVPQFVIKNGGQVGIGAVLPTAMLDVNGTASISSQLAFRAGAGAIQTTNMNTLTIGGATTGNLAFLPQNGVGFSTFTGRLGLNTTTTPLAALDIRGINSISPAASISANNNAFAGFVVDNRGNGDVFTASRGGKTLFTIGQDRIQLGTGSATGAGGAEVPQLLGLDSKGSAGDPGNGRQGDMYYNTADDKFRCFQGSGWTDCIAISAAEYMRAEMQGSTGTDEVDADDHIKFDTVSGSGGASISLDTTSSYTEASASASVGRFTLAAGKTYKLTATIPQTVFSGTTGTLVYGWFNITSGSYSGSYGGALPATYTGSNSQFSPYAEAIITTTTATTVELRMSSATLVSSITGAGTKLYPNAFIQVISGAQSVSAYEYMQASMTSNQTSDKAVLDHLKFNNVDAFSGSSISLNTGSYPSLGRFTLKAGKTYRMRGSILFFDPAGTSNGIVNYQWYNVTNSTYYGSQGMVSEEEVEAFLGYQAGNTQAEAIITATADTTVELRFIGLTGNIDGINSGAYASLEVISDGTQVAQFTGATSAADGAIGYVPAPLAGQQGSLLLGNGTWTAATNVAIGTTLTQPIASFSAATSFAGLVVNNNGAGDLFTASSSGLARFTIKQNGQIQFGPTYTTCAALTVVSNVLTCSATGGGSAVGWDVLSGALVPQNTTYDLLFGSVASNSAKFHLYGSAAFGGTQPVASIGGNTAQGALIVDNRVGDLFAASSSGVPQFVIKNGGQVGIGIGQNFPTAMLDVAGTASISSALTFRSGAGAIQTTNMNTLTIGGASTGNLAFLPQNGVGFSTFTGRLGLNTTTTPLAALDIRGINSISPAASISANNNAFAAMVVNNRGNGDIFTASRGGKTVFTVGFDRVQIGTGSATGAGGAEVPQLLGLDSKGSAGDPGNGRQGDMYYNTADDKFRCFQGSGWTDCIAGLTQSEYLRAERTNIQQSPELDVNDRMYFNVASSSAGSSISLNTSSFGNGGGQITLKAGRTYRLYSDINQRIIFGSNTTALVYGWYNVTSGAYIAGNSGSVVPVDVNFGDSRNQGSPAEAIFTPSVDTTVEVRIRDLNSGSLTSIGLSTLNLYPYAYVEVLSGAQTVSASEYLRAELNTTQNTAGELDDNDHIKFDTVQAFSGSSIRLDTSTTPYVEGGSGANIGRFTLSPGKTYRLEGHIFTVFGAADSQATYQWYDVTNGTALGSGAYENSTNRGDVTGMGNDAEAVITPTTTVRVELRLITVGIGSIASIGTTPSGTSAFIEVLSDGTQVAQFTGATAAADGAIGYVPAPLAGQQGSLLLGNGTWTAATNVKIGTTLTEPIATFSARTSFAGLVVDNTGSGDLFTASSSGLNRFVIKQNGNVGIGTTLPAANLHLVQTITQEGLRIDSSNANLNGAFAIYDPSGLQGLAYSGTYRTTAAYGGVAAFDTPALGVKADVGDAISLRVGHLSGNPLYSTAATASISAKTSFATLVVDNNGSGDIFTASSSGLSRFVIKQNGNVGIGTTLPSANLHIVQTTTTQQALRIDAANSNLINAIQVYDHTGSTAIAYSSTFKTTTFFGGLGSLNTPAVGIQSNSATGIGLSLRVGHLSGSPLYSTAATASISAKTSFATLVVDNDGAGDLFTASSSGLPRFTIRQDGSVTIAKTNNASVDKLGTLTISDNSGSGTSNLALINTAGGANNFTALDFYTTSLHLNVPTSSIRSVDDGNFSNHLTFSTRIPGTITLAERMRLTNNGLLGLGTTSPLGTLDIRANSTNGGTIPVASVSGRTSSAALITDNSLGDLFTASSSGLTRFVIANNGNVTMRASNSALLTVENEQGADILAVDAQSNKIDLLASNGLFGASSWSTTNSLITAHDGSTVVSANGYLYNIGGASNGAYTNANDVEYARINADGTVGPWMTTTSLPDSGRSEHTTVVANGYVYVMGGSNGTTKSTVFYARLNPDGTIGSWNSTTPLPAVRSEASSVVMGEYVYVIGGYDGGAWNATVYYAKLNADGTLGAWNTATQPIPANRSNMTAVTANGYIYLLGGKDGSALPGGLFSTIYYTKPATNGNIVTSWLTQNLPAARQLGTSVVVNGYIYYMGGKDSADTTHSDVYFAPLNSTSGSIGTWQNSPTPFTSPRQNHASAVVNGYIYVLGGGNNGSFSSTTVSYITTARVRIGGNLDLIGMQGQMIASGAGDLSLGTSGGSLTAGNGMFVGGLQVLGQTNLTSTLNVNGNFTALNGAFFQNSVGTVPVASIAANTSFSAFVVNNSGAGDLFTASSSGTTRFTINNNGNITNTIGNQPIVFATEMSNSDAIWKGGLSNDLIIKSLSNNPTEGIFFQNEVVAGGGTPYDTMAILMTGQVGIGTTSPLAGLDIRGNFANNSLAGTQPVASISGRTSFATLVVNNQGSGDLLTASTSGQTRFTVGSTGNVYIGGDSISASSTATLVNNGSPAFVNALGDQGSLIPNAGFEAVTPGVGFADSWIVNASSSATAVTRDNTTAAQGDASMKVTLNNQVAVVSSACVPIASSGLTGQSFNLSYFTKLGQTANVPTVRAYVDTFTSKANCQRGNSASFSGPVYTANLSTTNWVAQQGAAAITGSLGSGTWARVRFFFHSATASNNTVNVDGVKLMQTGGANGLDYAEMYPADPNNVPQPGEVVMLDASSNTTVVVPANKAVSQSVIGVVSTQPGQVLDDGTVPEPKVPIALAGRIPVKVSAQNGPIAVGDYLTSSDIPGVAVKATQPGTVIGKAMESYTQAGIGTIIVFVNLTNYDPYTLTNAGNISVFEKPGAPALNSASTYGVRMEDGSEVIKTGLFSDAIIGNLRTGSLDVQSLSLGGQNLNDRLLGLEGNYASAAAGFATPLAQLQSQMAAINTQVLSLSDRVASLEAQLTASGSALFMNNPMSGFTASTGAELSLDKLEVNGGILTDSLSVLGYTTMNELSVTGSIRTGVLTIKGQSNGGASISTLNGDLKLQDQGFGGIDILDGKVTIDTTGNVETVGEITAKKFNVDTKNALSASAGTGTVLSGTKTTIINTTAVTTDSIIQITFTNNYYPATRYWIKSKTAGASFTVELDIPVTSNAKFSWFIIN